MAAVGNIRSLDSQHLEGPPAKKQKHAILYMSITGNPAHLGQMAAVAAAIDALRARNITIDQVFVSLSWQKYVEGKTAGTTKICLSQEDRVNILIATIVEATRRNMFGTTPVNHWDDQAGGVTDHPESYQKLAIANPGHDVYLVAGADLCNALLIRNWEGRNIQNAIIVGRENQKILYPDPEGTTRIYVEPRPEYAHMSSTEIQKGEQQLATEACQNLFDQRKTALEPTCVVQ